MSITNEDEESWETGEVITWLTNDEGCYRDLEGEDAETIEQYVVVDRLAPPGLYESFQMPPRSKWSDVDWTAVAESLKEEE